MEFLHQCLVFPVIIDWSVENVAVECSAVLSAFRKGRGVGMHKEEFLKPDTLD